MGLLNKLFAGGGSKVASRFKQFEKLLGGGKLAEAADFLVQLQAEIPSEAGDEAREMLKASRVDLFQAYLQAEEFEPAIALAVELGETDDSLLKDLVEPLVKKEQYDPRVIKLTEHAVSNGKADKRLMLQLAKGLFANKRDNLEPVEVEFISAAAAKFPLWKEGVGTLADRYLREGRNDADALVVYRNAYPNRKADRQLREVLLDSLILNADRDEFAAMVYKDAVETGDNPAALKLLAEHYIEAKDFTPATLPYIERALNHTEFEADSLRDLAELVVAERETPLDKVALLSAIYRQGYSDRNLLMLLSDSLAEANRFDEESISVMTAAFEQRVVSKRAVLILTEHCLANEREDDFALRVYENYLSTWPDRPQRSIYKYLAHHYAALTRVDDQAQKIYEEALEDVPTDSIIVTILARAYQAADRRDEPGEDIYRRAFPVAEESIKKELAAILAELRLDANDFSEETLQYLTIMGPPTGGPLKSRYQEALTNCFLATGRRGELAQQAYFNLFEQTEDSEETNPRLVTLLSEIILERQVPPTSGSVEMRVYRKLFEQQKFSTEPDVCFALLDDAFGQVEPNINIVHLAVRCFETDSARLIKLLVEREQTALLQATGDFYIEHYNFPLAAQAFLACFELTPTDELRYRLVKIHLLDEHSEQALERLQELSGDKFGEVRKYWEAAAYQQMDQPNKARQLLESLGRTAVPPYLVKLRMGMNLELEGDLPGALSIYEQLSQDQELGLFQRWLGLERGIVQMKLGLLVEARQHLEEVHRHNPSGRAEQLFLSIALFMLGKQLLDDRKLDEALPLFTQAVDINRTHRGLREVSVNLLTLFGEREFFSSNLADAAKILEVAHRILPKLKNTRVLLAYSYHRMQQYAKALIYYRDLSWGDEDPRLERSQAYAYMANRQPQKAWRVFLDLAKRGQLLKENFPRLVFCSLKDESALAGQFWEKVEFPEDVDGLQLAALLIHDGQYQRAVDKLNQLIKGDPENLQLRWYLGLAYSHIDQRDLAVHNWKELLRLVAASQASTDMKVRQLTEIGVAFLDAGYAQEALQTWEQLSKLDEKNPDMPVLYAATLDLNAYQLARKEQNKLAREEWKKAIKYDQDNWYVLHNLAVANLLLSDLDESTKLFGQLGVMWKNLATQNPRQHGGLVKQTKFIERVLNTIQLTKGRPEFDITKVRAEDTIDSFQQANHFYWILSLDKYATEAQIEREYFRLIKIFNPERHADDFMLVEESYTNLIKNPERRQLIDLFVFNPLRIDIVRQRLSNLSRDGKISFEQIDLPISVPSPDFQQLEPMQAEESDVVKPLTDLLAINFKIPDWKVL